jgi:hypothetical protein
MQPKTKPAGSPANPSGKKRGPRKSGVMPPPRVDRDGYVLCRVCRCTEREACNPPCSWVPASHPPIRTGNNITVEMEDLCSTCHAAAVAILEWADAAHRPSKAALWREAERMREMAAVTIRRARSWS